MKRLFGTAALVAASLAIALILGEAALRAIGFSAPVWYEPDPQLGWTLRPGMGAWFTKEGRAYVTTNAEGRRDRDTPLAKAPGTYRIAVLGDSYSEAMQVEREQAYWALLPPRLQACGFQSDKRIEVLNFGVSGYGTAQELAVLETRAMRYRPDLVLLQFTNGNDVRNNSFALEEEKYRPFYMLQADGSLQVNNSFARSESFQESRSLLRRLARSATDRSRVLQLVRSVRSAPLLNQAHASDGAAESGIEQGLEPMVLRAPQDRLWREAWEITERLIAMTADHAQRNGARFLLFTVPYAIQVHPDPQVRAGLQAKLEVPDLFYPDRRLEQLGAKHNIPVLALAPRMQRLAETQNAYFHGFPNVGWGRGHWNAEGHRVAADLIAEKLCAER